MSDQTTQGFQRRRLALPDTDGDVQPAVVCNQGVPTRAELDRLQQRLRYRRQR